MPSLDSQWSPDEIYTKPFIEQKITTYPELEWLCAEGVALTQEGASTVTPTSWSVRLGKGKHYGEFERSMLSLVICDLILSGSQEAYEKLTRIQQKDRLSLDSFKELHTLTKGIAQRLFNGDAKAMRQTLETALVLGDMGKTPHARTLVPTITEPDHDLFLDRVLNEKPDVFPSFQRLKPQYQQYIQQVTGLVHFGHVTHCEGTPSKMLAKIKTSGVLQHPNNLYDLEFLVHVCDVAAAGGHVNNQGSTHLTESTYNTLKTVKQALDTLKDQSEAQALEIYLQTRSRWIGLSFPEYPVLVRLACMLRLYTPEEGKRLLTAWERVPPETKGLLNSAFHPLTEDTQRVTPTYVPAVFVNIWGAAQVNQETRADLILQIVLPQIVRYVQAHGKGDVTLNFNQVAGYCRDNILNIKPDNFRLIHNKEGHVSVIQGN